MQTSLASLVEGELFILYKRGKPVTDTVYMLVSWTKPYCMAQCEVIGGEQDGSLVRFGGSKQVSASPRMVQAIKEKTPLSELINQTNTK